MAVQVSACTCSLGFASRRGGGAEHLQSVMVIIIIIIIIIIILNGYNNNNPWLCMASTAVRSRGPGCSGYGARDSSTA
jgi:hypothetical protein